MIFKCVNKLFPDCLIEKFTLRSQIRTRNTKQSGQLNISRYRRTTGQQSFTYDASLRDDVKSSESVKVFTKIIV